MNRVAIKTPPGVRQTIDEKKDGEGTTLTQCATLGDEN
jgi:hypothetical protein